ncbi:MAG: AraC family transcriptional regulator [Bacillota bacterium]|nr:AraC family transcriptional regulator [Bacillota bacterium]
MYVYGKTEIEPVLSVTRLSVVAYFEYDSSSAYSEHHDFWELLFIVKGELDIYLNHKLYHLKKGQMILYEPGIVHETTGDLTGTRVGYIGFDCLSPILNELKNCVIDYESFEKDLLINIIDEGADYFVDTAFGFFIKENVPPFGLQSLKNQIELLLIKIIETHTNKEKITKVSSNLDNFKLDLADRIILYFNDNIEKQVTLEKLSKEMGASVSNLKSAFKARHSSGIIDYFIDLKIKRAKQLIKKTSMNFTQISEELGFGSVHYFSRTFKQRTGMTPSQYSKSMMQ